MKTEPSLQGRHNRTGIAASLSRRAMLEVPEDLGPTSRGSSAQLGAIRERYTRAGGPIGTMPAEPPIDPSLFVLIDQLGARLAFERTGVRLYDALIVKRATFGAFRGGPERRDLEVIRDQELQHARMLDNLMADLGADPTALTPAANLQGVATRGLPELLHDPRTSLVDALEAVIVLELVDRESWSGLLAIARSLGRQDLAQLFETAERIEHEHLQHVRRWLAAGREAERSGA